MKYVVATVSCVFSIAWVTLGQTPASERLEHAINSMSDQERLIYLPLILRMPASTRVTLVKAKDRSLPNRALIKIYLAPEADRATDYFETQITEWNRKPTAKFRSVQIVANYWEADLIVARFMDREWARKEHGRYGPSSLPREDFLAPAFDYIAARKGNELEVFSLVYRLTPQQGRPESFREIRNRLFNLLKEWSK